VRSCVGHAAGLEVLDRRFLHPGDLGIEERARHFEVRRGEERIHHLLLHDALHLLRDFARDVLAHFALEALDIPILHAEGAREIRSRPAEGSASATWFTVTVKSAVLPRSCSA
jgi:hypothetical protein